MTPGRFYGDHGSRHVRIALTATDAQIAEEHAFAAELAQADLPVVPPLALSPLDVGGPLRLSEATPTLAHVTTDEGQTFRFSVSERRVGRAPELEDPEVLRWIGRLLARLHAVGRQQPFAERLTWASAAPSISTASASGFFPAFRDAVQRLHDEGGTRVLVQVRRQLGADSIITVRRRGWMLAPHRVSAAIDLLASDDDGSGERSAARSATPGSPREAGTPAQPASTPQASSHAGHRWNSIRAMGSSPVDR